VATQYIKYVYGHEFQLGLVRLLDLEGENNLPSWYSSFALLLSSALLGIIGLHRKREANPYARHWLALAIVFLCLSIDEAASIHEMTDPLLDQWLKTHDLGYVLRLIGTAWVLAGVLFAVIVLLLSLRFLQRLPFGTRMRFLIAGGLYVSGAIGLEVVGGRYIAQYGGHTLTYSIMVAIEEGLEMVGVVAFLHALMLYMAKHEIWFQLVLDSASLSSREVSVLRVEGEDRGAIV
jgi:hypothetical protein